MVKKIILDTDIGPDCDDAGALAGWHYCMELWRKQCIFEIKCAS
jgi:hypothetical protein